MAQPSFPNDLKYRLERIEAELNELHRKLHPKRQPNLRDLQDVNGWGADTAYILSYDTEFGRFRPMLAPPFLRFNLNGTLAVSASDHDPVGASGKLTQLEARLSTAGSSTTAAVLKHTDSDANTVTVAVFSFASGSTTPTTTSVLPYSFYDGYWTCEVTAAGTGAAGLVVNGWGTAGAALGGTATATVSGITYSSTLLALSPTMYWKLDETSGTAAADASGNGNTGTYNGTYTLQATQLIDDGSYAVSFTDGYIRRANIVGDTMTAIAWIKTSQAGGADTNAYNGPGIWWADVSGGANDIIPMAIVTGGKLGFFTGSGAGGTTLVSATAINDNVRHMIAVTRNQSTGAKQIYIDGSLDASATHETGVKTANANMDVGKNTGDNRPYVGTLDEVAVFSSVLSGDDIAALWAAGS